MTVFDVAPTVAHIEPSAPPKPPRKPILQLFFGDLVASVLTVATGVLLILMIPALNWAVVDAVWATEAPSTCRERGACWAFIAAKFRFIMFGVYPPDEQWRSRLVMGLILAMILASLSPRLSC